jgi:DNA polymerase III alpha subunit
VDLETLIRAGACDEFGKRLTMLSKLQERWTILDKRKKKPEKAISLFTESIEGLGEGVQMAEAEKQGDHLRLLSGCYVAEVEGAKESPIRLIGTVKDLQTLEKVVERAAQNRGKSVLILGFLEQSQKVAWVQAGLVKPTQALRDDLERLGVRWSEE